MIKDDCTREEAEALAARGGRVLEWRNVMDEVFAKVEVPDDLMKPEPKKAEPKRVKKESAAK